MNESNDNKNLIRQSVIRDMSEGVMTIGLDGKIMSINPAAEKILEKHADDIVGAKFARAFFEYEENDAFNQTVLDAVYDADKTHRGIVGYFTGETVKHLNVTTSYLREGDEKIGVIVVISDISELVELRDAVKAMEKIRALNSRLEIRNKLLSETFGRFLSDEIVKQLLEEPDGLALGGKKRNLTVLMSDLRGFTAMSERMPAHDLLNMLNHYLGEMTEVIQNNGGTIIEFIGDGIMAIFGAPEPSDDHAAQAVASAVGMQAKMKAINEWNAAHGYEVLQMGIGVNTGDVIVGNIGSEKRTKYGVTGANVNLCGRIESYTVGGQVLISPSTREAIGAELEIAGEISVMPKGVSEPLTLSSVVGIGKPYNLHYKIETALMRKLSGENRISFSLIREKHTSKEVLTARMAEISSDGARIRTDAEINVFDNIEIDIGEKLFAKVIGEAGGTFELRFTSKPECFDEWMKKLK